MTDFSPIPGISPERMAEIRRGWAQEDANHEVYVDMSPIDPPAPMLCYHGCGRERVIGEPHCHPCWSRFRTQF